MTVTTEGTDRSRVFRARAVLIAGFVDFTLGLALLVVGLSVMEWRGNHGALPIGLAISLVGLILLLTGFSRVTSRLEVTETSLVWTWGFSRHEVGLSELEDAALVEKGSPASGASWAGFLGGGFLLVLVWWLVELITAFVGSEPSLGALDLVVMKHHGSPIEIKPISAWSTRSSHSQANVALQAVQLAIASSARPSAAHRLQILQHDAWEPSGEP